MLQGDLPDYVKQLQAFPDINQPDGKGRLPLIEAVKSRKANFVEMALEYGAVATATEEATGRTALYYAYSMKDVAVRSPRALCCVPPAITNDVTV